LLSFSAVLDSSGDKQELSFKEKARDAAQKLFPKLLSQYQRIRMEGSQETGFTAKC
jgi:hypothetical protein